MFCINTLTSELDGICIPAMRCLRATHVIKIATEIAYRFGDCLSASLADLALTGRQRFFTYVHHVTQS